MIQPGGVSSFDHALLVGRQRGRGEVRHGRLLAAQVPSVGKEVKWSELGRGNRPSSLSSHRRGFDSRGLHQSSVFTGDSCTI